jgi:hypothetical protein
MSQVAQYLKLGHLFLTSFPTLYSPTQIIEVIQSELLTAPLNKSQIKIAYVLRYIVHLSVG